MRRALLAILAVTATVAFGVGAAGFDDAVAEAGAPSVSGDVERTPSDGGGSGSPADTPDSGGVAGGCLLCGLSARSLVAGLLPSTNPLALVGAAAVVVTVAAVAGLRTADDADPVGLERNSGGTSTTEPGAAGATRSPAQAPPTNDVYRAWTAMTDRVPADVPDAATPGEYASRAVDAGFDREAVDRLTRTFRAVRYGGADATAVRERTASEALDAIDGKGEA
jgi:hypothetical protein